MRERPILFSAPMVRAILDGKKTQTRRVVKPQPTYDADRQQWSWERRRGRIAWSGPKPEMAALLGAREMCPYGVPGDRLWVKEGISRFDWMDGGETSVEYVATPGVMHDDAEWVWKRDSLPGMFMPRGLSRLTLTITDVRVERLQQINTADAVAEGVCHWDGYDRAEHDSMAVECPFSAERLAYARLWDSLNAARGFGWDANPWVWMVSFTAQLGGEL